MSDLKTVKVAAVEVKTGGGTDGKREWTRYILVDGNGEKCSTFDTKIGKFVQDKVGQQIDITVEQDGKFTNLLSASEHVEAPKQSGTAGGYARDPETELRIAREAALHAVTRLNAGSGMTVAQVLRDADVLVRWIYSGETQTLVAMVNGNGSAKPNGKPATVTPIRPQSNERSAVLLDCSRLFNQHAEEAMRYLAERGLPVGIADLSDEQLIAFRDHLGDAIPF